MIARPSYVRYLCQVCRIVTDHYRIPRGQWVELHCDRCECVVDLALAPRRVLAEVS